MIGTIWTVALALATFWVYWDATRNHIGRSPDGDGFFNLSAIGWAIATACVGWLAFPAYLAKRSELVRRAASAPVPTARRRQKLFALGATLIAIVCVVASQTQF